MREAVRLEPELPAAHHNLATVLVARGDWAEAEYHLERAIENNPSDVQIYMDYAAILAQRGLYGRAQDYLDEALKLDPGRPDAHSLKAEILASAGKIEEAATPFREGSGAESCASSDALQLRRPSSRFREIYNRR